VLAPAVVGGLLFTAGLLMALRCGAARCPVSPVSRLFDLDRVGGLPRLFTTAVLVAVAVHAALAARRAAGRRAWWWAAVAAGAGLLAAAKAVSTHSALERDDGTVLTLVGGVLLTLVGLPLLWAAGRRWAVPGSGAVAAALAAYAVAALGLDQLTGLVAGVTTRHQLRVLAIFLEEGGEAATALALLAVVARWVPRRDRQTGWPWSMR
jgi:hypothetical protein